jgi:hypothetical protein
MDPNTSKTTSAVFLPPLPILLRNVGIWTDYFFRWSNVPSVLSAPHDFADYIPNKSKLATESLNEPSCIDLELKPAAIHDSIWEGAYLREKEAKENLAKHLEAIESQNRASLSSGDAGQTGTEDKEKENHKLTIERLTSLLRRVEVNDEAIEEALTGKPQKSPAKLNESEPNSDVKRNSILEEHGLF